MSEEYGFGAKKMDVAGFKPTPREEQPQRDPEAERRWDEIAEKHGFVSREPVQPLVRVERQRKQAVIQDTLYVRAALTMTNRFKNFCNSQRMSYGDALEYLMDKADIPS